MLHHFFSADEAIARQEALRFLWYLNTHAGLKFDPNIRQEVAFALVRQFIPAFIAAAEGNEYVCHPSVGPILDNIISHQIGGIFAMQIRRAVVTLVNALQPWETHQGVGVKENPPPRNAFTTPEWRIVKAAAEWLKGRLDRSVPVGQAAAP